MTCMQYILVPIISWMATSYATSEHQQPDKHSWSCSACLERQAEENRRIDEWMRKRASQDSGMRWEIDQ